MPVAELADGEPHGEMRVGRCRRAARVLERLRPQRRPIDLGPPQRVLAHQRERGVEVARGGGRGRRPDVGDDGAELERVEPALPCPRTLTPNAISSTSRGNGSSIS